MGVTWRRSPRYAVGVALRPALAPALPVQLL